MKISLLNSLYNRLLMLLIVIALLPLMVLGAIGYRGFSNIMYEMIAKSNMQTLIQVESKIEGTFSVIDDVLVKTSVHPDIQAIMKKNPQTEWEAYQESLFYVNYTRLLMIGNNEIENITVFNELGKRIDSKGRFLHPDYLPIPGVYKQIGNELRSGTLSKVVSPTYVDNGKLLVSIGKTVLDLHSGKRIGYVVVDLNLNVLQSELKKVNLLNSGEIVLLNDRGEVVFHPSIKTGTALKDAWAHMMPPSSKPYVLHEEQGELSLYLRTPIEAVHWTLYGIVPYSSIQKETAKIRYKFYWFALAIVVALTIIALSLRNLFVKPIVKLQHLMRRVQSGDFFVRAHYDRKDEIGELSNSFNQMVVQIEQLIEKVYQVQLNESRALLIQKQAELEALQANITPHFLHNTLHSISWFANRKGVREIQMVVDALSSILGYSLTHYPRTVRLVDEFEYLQLYMEIIRFRYGNMIRFSFDLPEALQAVMIPRLSLQPIVENAIKHGFENIDGHEHIHILAKGEGKHVTIEVQDNGQGMPSDVLNNVNSLLANLTKENVRNSSETSIGGMGLFNVHYRMRLCFGEKFGIHIVSEEKRGTSVLLNIPYEFEELEEGEELPVSG